MNSVVVVISVLSLLVTFVGGLFVSMLKEFPISKKNSKLLLFIEDMDVTFTDRHYSFGFSFWLFGRRRIYVSKYAVELLTQREIIALILHEDGHIQLRHNLKDFLRKCLFEFSIVLLWFMYGRMDMIGVGFYTLMRLLTFIVNTVIYRRQETKADEYVCQKGYAKYYVNTLNKLKIYIKQSRTHPSIESRIANIKRYANNES